MKTKAALTACTAALFAFAALPAAQAKSPTPDAKARQCFWARNVTNFAAANEHTVNVRVGVRDVYQFEMLGNCPEIDWQQQIALVSRGSNFICSGMDADIVTRSTIGPQRCPVRSIRKLTPEEVAGLDRRAKP